MTLPPPAWAVVIPAAPASPHLNGLCSSLRGEEPPLVLVASEEPGNHGEHVPVAPEASFAERANRGIRTAFDRGCQGVVLLNDDTVVQAGACAALLEAALSPGVGIAGAVLLDWNSDTIQAAGIRIQRTTGRVHLCTDPPAVGQPSTPLAVDAVSGAALAVDRRCWEDTGGFDSRYSFYFEDIDLCHRARGAGFKVVLVPGARVHHKGGGTLSSSSRRAAALLGRNHLLFSHALGGSTVGRWARNISVAALGVAWTLKTQGITGLPAFFGGVADGVRTAARSKASVSRAA